MKIRSIQRVFCSPTPVYDLETEEFHNFALGCGVIVHNSKDGADAVGGSVYQAATSDSQPQVYADDLIAQMEAELQRGSEGGLLSDLFDDD